MKLRTYITQVFILLAIGLTYGQDGTWREGELFLKNGESKNGLIKASYKPGRDILFKPSKNAKKEKFKQTEVDHFINDLNEYHTYVPVSKKKKELFHLIVEGKANLYGRLTAGQTYPADIYGDKEFYILKEGEPIANFYLSKKVISLRKKALKYFSDCPALVKKLEDKTYNRYDYQLIVEEYNKCDIYN